ncbi:hypothetical protein C8J57DRAFT_1236891 [Mycena rebaudengoi]|nr:hypothetical protein C8J57DRAFT_1236891 [Mycena rebaudengoi]
MSTPHSSLANTCTAHALHPYNSLPTPQNESLVQELHPQIQANWLDLPFILYPQVEAQCLPFDKLVCGGVGAVNGEARCGRVQLPAAGTSLGRGRKQGWGKHVEYVITEADIIIHQEMRTSQRPLVL